ncbi:MAG: chromosomal replication initiator protein DnaA [Alistipes sp.]
MLTTTQTYSDMWQTCLDQIKMQTSEEEFAKWLQPIIPLEFDGTTLRLRVPNASYVVQIEKNYIKFLRPIISQLYGQQTRLHYAVPKAPAQTMPLPTTADTTAIRRFVGQTDTANIKNPQVIPGIKRIIIDSNLNPNYSFGSFIEGECNRLTRSAGMAVAVNPGGTPFNPLYVYGNSGLGKTHIAQAIGLEVKQRHPEQQVLYVSMNKFQAQYQTARINGEIPDFIHFYQMIDVLIIDDIQELTGKRGTQSVFFNIFNHLHLAGKQLILTSDKPPVELQDIEDRLLTRFKWGLTTQLQVPDYQTKIKIIQAKVQKLNVQISDEVIGYLADNISANVREIEGALSSLVANASFLGRKITTSLAKEILKVYVQLYQKEVTIEHIVDVVCKQLNLESTRFHSAERTREVAQARQIAMFLAKRHTKIPLTAIGAAIGGRNHATVLHSFKAVSNLIETDKAFSHQVDEIEKLILI